MATARARASVSPWESLTSPSSARKGEGAFLGMLLSTATQTIDEIHVGMTRPVPGEADRPRPSRTSTLARVERRSAPDRPRRAGLGRWAEHLAVTTKRCGKSVRSGPACQDRGSGRRLREATPPLFRRDRSRCRREKPSSAQSCPSRACLTSTNRRTLSSGGPFSQSLTSIMRSVPSLPSWTAWRSISTLVSWSTKKWALRMPLKGPIGVASPGGGDTTSSRVAPRWAATNSR